LHDGHRDKAWTNLLAVTRLVTVVESEPPARLRDFARVVTGQSAVWEAIHSKVLTDGQLATLQHEWEQADFMAGLDQVVAFSRVSTMEYLIAERQTPLNDFSEGPLEALKRFTRPLNLLHVLRYRKRGTYQEEKAMLLYFRDREIEMRQALRFSSWAEMQASSGVTNAVPFAVRPASEIGSLINSRTLILPIAVQAEARRRVIITAIALERYRRQHGVYPTSLTNLAPAFLAAVPLDFMDGRPLRYQPTDAGFVLYSVGLDCMDDGGDQNLRQWQSKNAEKDLVWPRPASEADIEIANARINKERQGFTALWRSTGLSAEEFAFRKRYGLDLPARSNATGSTQTNAEAAK
jgi:hypothetical protein